MPRIKYLKSNNSISSKSEDQLYLESRLEQLESAICSLQTMLDNEDSVLYADEFSKRSLTKYLSEAASIRRRLAEVK